MAVQKLCIDKKKQDDKREATYVNYANQLSMFRDSRPQSRHIRSDFYEDRKIIKSVSKESLRVAEKLKAYDNSDMQTQKCLMWTAGGMLVGTGYGLYLAHHAPRPRTAVPIYLCMAAVGGLSFLGSKLYQTWRNTASQSPEAIKASIDESREYDDAEADAKLVESIKPLL